MIKLTTQHKGNRLTDPCRQRSHGPLWLVSPWYLPALTLLWQTKAYWAGRLMHLHRSCVFWRSRLKWVCFGRISDSMTMFRHCQRRTGSAAGSRREWRGSCRSLYPFRYRPATYTWIPDTPCQRFGSEIRVPSCYRSWRQRNIRCSRESVGSCNKQMGNRGYLLLPCPLKNCNPGPGSRHPATVFFSMVAVSCG